MLSSQFKNKDPYLMLRIQLAAECRGGRLLASVSLSFLSFEVRILFVRLGDFR